jgi:hypothetical protein
MVLLSRSAGHDINATPKDFDGDQRQFEVCVSVIKG